MVKNEKSNPKDDKIGQCGMSKMEIDIEEQMRLNLCAMKERSKMSYADIEKACNVPISTLYRIFNQKEGSPKVCTVIKIVDALGGTMSELCGGEKQEEKMTDAERALMERMLRRKNNWIRVLAALLIILFLVLFVIYIFDAINPNVGYLA